MKLLTTSPDGRIDQALETLGDPFLVCLSLRPLHEQDGEIVKSTSPLDNSITLGNLCIKGRFGWRFVQPGGKAPT